MSIKVRRTTSRCYTEYQTGILGDLEATSLYEYLKENMQWEEGIRSRKGFTRLAASLEICDDIRVSQAVRTAVSVLGRHNYFINGIYINYYQNGEMWTPNHTHRGTHQLVISLGARRDLVVAKKTYQMENGSAIIFGSSVHGVPKCDVQEGRISIAVFLIPYQIEFDEE